MKKLTDKNIVVTGGSGLLGQAILQKLQAEGARIINVDVNVDDQQDGSAFYCDITSETSIVECIHKIRSRYSRIDGLVNNAYPRTSDWGLTFEQIPFDSWKKNVDFQLNSYFFMSQQILAVMKEQKSGSVVNIGSIYGSVGPDFSVYDGTAMTMPAAYAAIKGGLVNLTRYLASYYGPSSVRVNCVSPGGVFNDQPESFVKKYSAKTPLRRMAYAEDISPAVAFLLSDEAAYITGHNLVVDGGWTAI